MRKKLKALLKIVAFVLIFSIVLTITSTIVQPVWLSWNNYYTQKGFYAEKENTIETIFLGPSTMLTDLIPTELYENYGICAYNLCTEQQPVLASYIWTEEAYKYHSESLKTVVFCVSELRDKSSSSIYHKALDNLKPSFTKFKALTLYNEGNIFEAALDMIPLYSYHGRWEEMTTDDLKNIALDPDNGTRGYHFSDTVYGLDYVRRSVKNVTLDETAEPEELVESSVLFFEWLVDFCKEKDIELILTKAPAKNWNSALHNAVDKLAEKHGLDFYDLNYGEYYDELGLMDTFDSSDGGTHMNYFGATKITDWYGKLLTEKYGATDVRGNPEYGFMESQLERFNSLYQTRMELHQADDITECLSIAMNEDTTVFIMLNDTVTENLTDEQRAYFKKVGLKTLSEIKDGDSYVAVIEGGKVKEEKLQAFDYVKTTYSLSYKGQLPDGKKYELTSGGSFHGKASSCLIEGEEKCQDERGIHIAVYNNKYSEFMYASYFDTHLESERDCYKLEFCEYVKDPEKQEELKDNEIFMKVLVRYNDVEALKADKQEKLSLQNNYVTDYLDFYRENENAVIIISAKGDAVKAVTDENRASLKEYGLTKLSQLENEGTYIAVITSEGISYEESGEKGEALTYSDGIFTVKSGDTDSKITASVKVNGKERSENKNGLNVVVIDKNSGEILSSGVFDTENAPIRNAIW